MIQYEFGKWGIRFIFRLSGSVFPVALVFAVPCSALSVVLWYYFNHYVEKKPDIEGAKTLFNNYSFVLGFLLVFRTQIAYSRFWEGGSILQDMRSSWLNVTSSLMAFSNADPRRRDDVDHFFHLLIRLMSMMHCSALQEVADMEDENFDIINCDGVDIESMKYLISLDSAHRVEVLLQWIQRLVVNMQITGVVTSPAPIVSRVFQELADGRMSFNAAKKIAAFPFPFPYAQMLMVMLIIHWVSAPVMAALLLDDIGFCAIATFVTSVAFWCINYIAAELEMPFGDNDNDLPVEDLQVHFNASLARMMHPLALSQPEFNFQREYHDIIEYKKMAAVEQFFLSKPSKRTSKSAIHRMIPRGQPGPGRRSGRLSQLVSKSRANDENAGSVSRAITGSSTAREGSAADFAFQPKANGDSENKQKSRESRELKLGATATLSHDLFRRSCTGSGEFQGTESDAQEMSERLASIPALEAYDASRMEERMARIVQDLVHLLVPAACSRLAEATSASKRWLPESDVTSIRSPLLTAVPEPAFFEGGHDRDVSASDNAELHRDTTSLLRPPHDASNLLRSNDASSQLRPHDDTLDLTIDESGSRILTAM